MIGRILPAILILISVGIFLLYVSPTYKNKVIPLQNEIKKYDAALAAAEDFRQKEAQLATERASLPQDGVEKVGKFLPDGVDNVQLIVDLNALASRSGVTLSNFNIKDTKQGGVDAPAPMGGVAKRNVESLDLSVTVTGSYQAFRTFLYGVEHSLRPLDVTQLIVTNADSGVYNYDVTFRIYWLH